MEYKPDPGCADLRPWFTEDPPARMQKKAKQLMLGQRRPLDDETGALISEIWKLTPWQALVLAEDEQKWSISLRDSGKKSSYANIERWANVRMREAYMDAFIISMRGNEHKGEDKCSCCKPKFEEDEDGALLPGPFKDCITWEGNLNGACSNCIWLGQKLQCSYHDDNVAKAAHKTKYEKARDDATRNNTTGINQDPNIVGTTANPWYSGLRLGRKARKGRKAKKS